MDKRNGRPFSPIHVIMLLISCLTVMGCYNPDWSDKDADFLITQLKNNRYYPLREKAVHLLASKAQQERDKVIPALTHALLNDEYAYVRDAAADVLGSIEPPAVSAIPALIETLRDENTGKVGGFDSDGRNVHDTVITSLGEMGPDAAEAIPALTEFFRGGSNDAGLAILKIDPSMHAVKEELIERRAVRQLEELAEAGDVSLVPVLIKFLNGSKHIRAARALKDIGTSEALDAAIPVLIQLVNDPETEDSQRLRAARALKDIGTSEALDAAIPVLIQLVNDPETEDSQRLRAARTLKDIGTPEALDAAIPAFIQLLNTPKKAEDKVRRRYARYAAEELKDIGTPEALDAAGD